MTREDAIQALKDLRDIRLQGVEWKESLDMAIEALSADAVSREEYEFKENLERINERILSASKKLEEKGLFKRVDYVEVVRCEDCKHGQYDATHYFCAEHGHKVYEDDFCSSGERKEE